MTFRTSATSSGSSALVTSSSSSRSGCIASARTIATRCCWPPDSRSGYSSRLSASPNRSSSSVASASAFARGAEHLARRQRHVVEHGHVREQVERLEHDPDAPPDPVDVDALGAVISSPSTTIRPASIGSSRLMQRRSVDLPDPDAPMRQTTSCSATTRSIPRRTSSVPNDLWSPSMRSASRAGPPGRHRPATGRACARGRARRASPSAAPAGSSRR